MKLFFAVPSPFARKVRVLVAEKKIPRIELVTVSPFDTPQDLVSVNPLCKVPSLLLDDDSVLYDSPLICEYLDQLGEGPRLIPADGKARWTVQRRHALADGLMETTQSLALEINRRPEHERSPKFIQRWCATMARAVAALEAEIDGFGPDIDMGHIATGCALAYLDLRASEHLSWRSEAPQLTNWFADFERRPSMQSTRPS